MERWESFEPGRQTQALGRFERLCGRAVPSSAAVSDRPTSMRRLRPNRATALLSRINAAFAAGEFDFFEMPPEIDYEEVDHTTGVTFGREGSNESVRRLSKMPSPVLRYDRLATLGEHLALTRRTTGAAATEGTHFDVGAFEHEGLCICEVGQEDFLRRNEVFGAGRFSEAIPRLYERYAELLPDGPEKVRAQATARTVALWLRETGAATLLDHDVLTEDFEMLDHRLLRTGGTGGTWSAKGRDEAARHLRSLLDLAEHIEIRHNDVLALRPEGLLVRRDHHGVRREEGGLYERHLLALMVMRDDGRMARMEMFDADCEAEALARFVELLGEDDREALVDGSTPRQADEGVAGVAGGAGGNGLEPALAALQPRFENAASRSARRFEEAWNARDWEAIEATVPAGFLLEDRRSYAHLELDREQHLASLRERFDMPTSRYWSTLLATRGDRLSLVRAVFDLAGGDVGDSQTESLILFSLEESGECTKVVTFDAEDFVKAHLELDALYEGEDGTCMPVVLPRAFLARDWDEIRSQLSPSFVQEDRRSLSLLGTTRGPEGMIANFRTMADLAPDTVAVFHHVRGHDRAHLAVASWQGTQLGGAYEIPLVALFERDDSGRVIRNFLYDQDRIDEAWAHFEATRRPGGASEPPAAAEPFLNAAARTSRSILEAYIAGNWERFEVGFAPEFRYVDRRPFAHLDLDRSEYLAFTRGMDVAGRRSGTWEMLATRGERLVLQKIHFQFEGGAGDDAPGRSELDFLTVVEVGADGLLTRFVRFDSKDYESAIAELDERFQAGEAAEHGIDMSCLIIDTEAARRGDWEEFSRGLRPDLRVEDHRILRFGNTLTGAEAFVETQKALFELAPDCRYRFDHIRCKGRAVLCYAVQMGTREGGAFESHFLSVTALAGDGSWEAVAAYDLEQFDQAWARFQEWGDSPSVSSSFENLATRNVDQTLRAYMETDPRRSDGSGARDAFGPYYAQEFRYQDRRGIAHLNLTRDEWFSFMDEMRTAGRRSGTWRHVATRGERLSIFRLRVRYSGGDGSAAVGESELEFLTVVEVDATGAATAHIRFEVDDEEAAYAELDARFLAGEAKELGIVPRRLGMNQEAARRGDWDAFARGFRDDVHLADHRILGFGDTLDGVAGFIESQKALYELAPDSRYRLDHIRFRGRAGLAYSVQMGTREGGAFESHFLAVTRVDADDRWQSLDIYDVDRFDDAMARFLEIADGGTPAVSSEAPAAAAPVTTGTTPIALANARMLRAVEEKGWEGIRPFVAEDFRWEDRRRLFRMSGDLDLMIASLSERSSSGLKRTSSVVSEAGDRVEIRQTLWSGGGDDDKVEIEFLMLTEVDEKGLVRAILTFDLEDRLEAQREAWARWAAIDPSVAEPLATMMRCMEAFERKDRQTLRQLFVDDVMVVDHRHAAMERFDDADAYVDSIAVLWDLAPDQRLELGSFLFALESWGYVASVRRAGEIADGGPFESLYLNVMHTRDGRVCRTEFFEREDLGAAMACFESFRPAEGDAPEAGAAASREAASGAAPGRFPGSRRA